MVRRGLVIALVLGALTTGAAHATGTSRVMGMYPTSTPGAPALPMVDSSVLVTVRGPIIETVVTQTFSNRGDHAIEATYIFPLPVDAAVSAMAITTGSRTIHAAIASREDAQRRYEAAVRAGVSAAVLDQERPDVFTQTVAAIPARGTVAVTLRYDTVARHADGRWELALPMVVAPRYVPGAVNGRPTTGTGRAPDTDRAPDASRVTPQSGPDAGGATKVTLAFLDPVTDVSSPTHELAGTSSRVSFTDPHSDHDAVIRWRSTTIAAGWIETAGAAGYAAVVVEAGPPVARKGPMRVVVVLDRAATITGDALVVVQPFVRGLLGALGSADRVSVIGADTSAWRSAGEALRATEQVWTGPGHAFDLTRTLAGTKPDGAAVVLISDGLVADDAAAIAAATRLGVPVHVIGVGPSPARGLLTQIAARTGGTIRFVLPSDDPRTAARAVVADVASLPAPLTVSWGTLAASDVVPSVLPRLGSGQAMLVLAKVKHAQTANARARGELFSLEAIPPSGAVAGATTRAGLLARRWAQLRLEDLLVGPRDPAAVTAHALAFGLVSPYTSLVAVGTEVVVEGGVKHFVAVPVSVPSGMRWVDVKRETTLDVTTVEPQSVNKPKEPVSAGKHNTDRRDGTLADRASDDEDAVSAREEIEAQPVQMGKVAAGTRVANDVAFVVEDTSPGTRDRGARIAVTIGGGIAAQAGETAGLLAVGARIDTGRRTLFGAESTLWLVDGLHAQGRLMLTGARRGLARWLEIGASLGLHVGGSGTGAAGSLSVRYHLPFAIEVAPYLRYDGALVWKSGDREPQHTLTLGLERSF